MSHHSTRFTDEEEPFRLQNANSGDYHALTEDGVNVSYCPDAFDDGPIERVDDTEPSVWVCATCGRITDRCTNDSGGRWSLDSPSDALDLSNWVIIRGRAVIEDVVPPVAVIDSPYAAKDDIKDLPFRVTDRRWSDELNSWVVTAGTEDRVIEHMSARGWNMLNLVQIVLGEYGN